MRYFFSLLLITLGSPAFADSKICGNVRSQDGRLSLTVNEKVLVCGSPKGSAGWKDVPLSQAEYHLRVFLQRDGHFQPRFEQQDGILKVWQGPRLLVSRFVIEQGPVEILDKDRIRKVIHYPLTSELMDEVVKWAEIELKSKGYACPKVDVKAQVWDQTVVLTVVPGVKGTVRRIDWQGSDGLEDKVLIRYSAMKSGETYDVRKTQITTNRLFADGLFEMALTKAGCDSDQVDLTVQTSVGKPRLVQFGFGASTEELPFMDLSFRNSRLDNDASSFYTLLHASPKLQSLSAGSELYVLSPMPSVFVGPRFKVARKSEHDYEENSARSGGDLGRYWDQFGSRFLVRGGPTLNYVKTVKGIGPSEAKYLSWEGSLTAASHDYELNVRQQYEGWAGRFEYLGQREEIGAQLNVDRYDASLKYLWNIGNYYPPMFVLAMRTNWIAVNANPIDLNSRRELLPLDYRIFWGGDQNLRGFARQSLNNGRLGYLSGVYGGLELRLIEELPFHLQPFVLFDYARLGSKRWTADPPIFISKGFGLRWASPIGTLRGSAARGEIQNGDASTDAYPEEWVYFFSFGQEF